MDKVHVYMSLYFASIESTAGNQTGLFSSPFLFTTSRFLILAEAFQSDHEAACRTVGLLSAVMLRRINLVAT